MPFIAKKLRRIKNILKAVKISNQNSVYVIYVKMSAMLMFVLLKSPEVAVLKVAVESLLHLVPGPGQQEGVASEAGVGGGGLLHL